MQYLDEGSLTVLAIRAFCASSNHLCVAQCWPNAQVVYPTLQGWWRGHKILRSETFSGYGDLHHQLLLQFLG